MSSLFIIYAPNIPDRVTTIPVANHTYRTGNSSLAHKDPTDAAQVPPSVLREHVGDPDIVHNDPHHGHDQRHGSVSHQEAHVVGKTV